MPKLPLHWQILAALALAVGAGLLTGSRAELFGVPFVSVYGFIGRLFINALKMLIVPLVVAAMITSIATIGSAQNFGRLSLRTLAFYMATTAAAVGIGVLAINLIDPGLAGEQPVGAQLGLDARAAEVAQHVKGRVGDRLLDVVLGVVPENFVEAARNADMLALIFFSLVFGYFMNQLTGAPGDTLKAFWEGVFDVMLRMTS